MKFTPSTEDETTLFENRRGIRVTETNLSTRFKDEALAPIQSVQIGREPLLIAMVLGGGLAGFACGFADLLYQHEIQILTAAGVLLILLGYITVPLKVGQYMHERTVFWSTIWTAKAVRAAIAKAKRHQNRSDQIVPINGD